MFKNNVIALLVHTCLSFIAMFIFINLNDGSISKIICTIPQKIFAYSTLTLIIAAIYLLTGFNLKDQGLILTNALSVSVVSLILISVWFFSEILNILPNGYYSIFNFSFFPLLYIFSNNKLVGIILLFIPSILLFTGLQLKLRKKV